MLRLLRSLVFPRACIGCDRDGVMLCGDCVIRNTAASLTVVHAGLHVRSCLPYEGIVRDAIAQFKRGRRAFADDLAAFIAPYVEKDTVLVPVPTTRRRRAERGFDQTVLLAKLLRKSCGVEVAELLGRRGNGAQQGRSRAERLAASGRFRLRKLPASGGRLVLFDDVRTTGATLADAAATLRDGGLAVTSALTLAWAPKETS